jgi:hypothetical protein
MRCWLVRIFVNLSTANWIFLRLPINHLPNWDLAYFILFPGAEQKLARVVNFNASAKPFCASILFLLASALSISDHEITLWGLEKKWSYPGYPGTVSLWSQDVIFCWYRERMTPPCSYIFHTARNTSDSNSLAGPLVPACQHYLFDKMHTGLPDGFKRFRTQRWVWKLVEPVELAYFYGFFVHERAKKMWFSFDECETYESLWSRQTKASELL